MTQPPAPQQKPRAIAYIDGFNLYYRALKNTDYKWLDLKALVDRLFPKYDVVAVKFFTAKVSDRPGSQVPHSSTSNRQQLYLRALLSTPSVQVIFGNFQEKEKRLPVAPIPLVGEAPTIRVLKTEEKGSDVNLAAELLIDAYTNAFDAAIVVSNDSDLERAVRQVAYTLNKPVHIATGGPYPITQSLRSASKGHCTKITDAHLMRSQFPATVHLPDGRQVTRPPSWDPGYVAPARAPLPNQTVRAIVQTVRGRFEQGEVEITLDPIGRLIQVPGQQVVVQRMPIVPTTTPPATSPTNSTPAPASQPVSAPAPTPAPPTPAPPTPVSAAQPAPPAPESTAPKPKKRRRWWRTGQKKAKP